MAEFSRDFQWMLLGGAIALATSVVVLVVIVLLARLDGRVHEK